MENVTFNGLTLVSEPGRVMTPRPATEDLVAAACARVRGRQACVADVGTGTGAIAVAIASACPDVEVWATDSNPLAVGLARRNVRRHGLQERVAVRQSDLLVGVPAPLDLVVANLPYLPAASAPHYPDLAGEPADAVFAHGDGLGPYRRLAQAAGAWLAPEGELLIQFRRRIIAATYAELDALGDALAEEPLAA